MSRSHQRAAVALRQLPAAVILKAADLCDGHSILDPQAFIDAGLPSAVVKHVTQTHTSDGTLKGTVHIDGQPVEQVEGVYGLHLLEFIALVLNVEYRRCFGRGSQARAIQQALREHFNTTHA